jgi:hypothetical protein
LCQVDVQQTGLLLTAPLYCYEDSPSIAVNPQVAGAKSCPQGDAQFCGDGLIGAAPPGRTIAPAGEVNFGDVDDKHAVLTGELNTTTGRVTLAGCMEDRDGMAARGNVYLSVDVDAYTGQGSARVYPNETTTDCTGGTPAGSPTPLPASLARQATAASQRDADSDGCPDARELSDSQANGGLRDPWNSYDYMNPTHDGQDRVDDILKVVSQYFKDDADSTPGFPPFAANYNQDTDRTTLAGGNGWNLGPPNGQQRVDDILAEVKQYFHDC